MPKWWFASTKYVIWPGSHRNCICKPARTIAHAFEYSSRSPAYCFNSLWLSFSGANCSQSLLTTVNRTVFLHEGCWHVCHIILPYFLVFWSQEQMNIITPWDAPNSELGLPKALFKVYHLAERFENFSARVFSQQKIHFLRKLKLLWEKNSFSSVVGRLCQAGFTFSEALKRYERIQTFQLVFLETLVFSTMGKYPFSTCL